MRQIIFKRMKLFANRSLTSAQGLFRLLQLPASLKIACLVFFSASETDWVSFKSWDHRIPPACEGHLEKKAQSAMKGVYCVAGVTELSSSCLCSTGGRCTWWRSSPWSWLCSSLRSTLIISASSGSSCARSSSARWPGTASSPPSTGSASREVSPLNSSRWACSVWSP